MIRAGWLGAQEDAMTPPSDLERFYGYVRGFEVAYLADVWSGVADAFSPDARHVVANGGALLGADDRGQDAVVAGLRAAVNALDRRFDARLVEIVAGPELRPEGVWMRFAVGMRRAGLPELRFEGDHLAVYADGRIRLLEETLEPGAGERVDAFLREHGAALRAPGSAFAPIPDPRDQRELDAGVARSLARCYAAAKSVRDAGAALAVCADDFALETPAFGTASRGRAETAAQLAAFFTVFPDYRVAYEGITGDGAHVAGWGRAQLTFAGAFGALAPTGKTAEIPFTAIFDVAGGVLRRERFGIDLAQLCEQIGVPV
ncbi:MAG: hypothetical protein DCC71_25635, partial [Proteobacteria bacterium]